MAVLGMGAHGVWSSQNQSSAGGGAPLGGLTSVGPACGSLSEGGGPLGPKALLVPRGRAALAVAEARQARPVRVFVPEAARAGGARVMGFAQAVPLPLPTP